MHVVPEWLELISLAFCMGVIACRLWFFTPAIQNEFSYRTDFVSGMWNLFCYGLAVLITGSIIELMARTAEMSSQPFPDFFSAVPTVLFRTHYGGVWIARMGALLLLAFLKSVERYRDRGTFLFLMLSLILLVSMSASASGHASDAGDLSLPEIMDWLHLLAAGAWGGGLMVLSVSVLPDLIGRKEPIPALVSRVAARFSTMAGFAVGIAAITALYNAWKYVGSMNALLGTPYGWTIIAKIVLFLVLVNLGGFNRYVSVPLLNKWAGAPAKDRGIFTQIGLRLFPRFQLGGSGQRIASRFKRSVKVEAILMIGVLFCAALLRHEIPARHALHLGHTGGEGQTMPHHNHKSDM